MIKQMASIFLIWQKTVITLRERRLLHFLVFSLFFTISSLPQCLVAMEHKNKRVGLLLKYPFIKNFEEEKRDVINYAKKNLLEDISIAFNKLCERGIIFDEVKFTFITFTEPLAYQMDQQSFKAKEGYVKDHFLKNDKVKNFIKSKNLDYMIIAELYELSSGGLWDFRWVFVEFNENDFNIEAGSDHYKCQDVAMFLRFVKVIPKKMSEDFGMKFRDKLAQRISQTEGQKAQAKETVKVLVTSCFYHRIDDEKRKEILDRLQNLLPPVLALDLKKMNSMKNYKIYSYDFPHKCVDVSDQFFEDIINHYDADYLISAVMDMEKTMNKIFFIIQIIPRDVRNKKKEPWDHKYNFDVTIVSKKLAKKICEKWPKFTGENNQPN